MGTNENAIQAVIFYHIAEYANFHAKLTYKLMGCSVQSESWDSANKKTIIKQKNFKTYRGARNYYLYLLGTAVIGQWKILNSMPKKVEWIDDVDEKGLILPDGN